MSKDSMAGYPPSHTQGGQRATNGGQCQPKPLPYSPPVGPKGQTHGPGIGGTNHGNAGTQGKR